ncbi:MAG: GtrA family protein [Desulfovibrio sp.]|nr:GtrA family protein [Desulfovibrio sp.]
MHIGRLYHKHRELIAYGIFGVLTTVVNYLVYAFCLMILGINYLSANLWAFILAVAFAFVTNKHYVFHSLDWKFSKVLRECLEFFSARIASLLMESALLWFFVEKLACDELIIKIFTNILVVIVNYAFSKLVIFKEHR